MKIASNFTLIILLISLFTLTSCDKEEELKSSSYSALITAAPWKLVSIGSNPGIDTDADGILENETLGGTWGESCGLDDLEIFHPNNTYTLDEGASMCYPNTSQVIGTGTWSLTNNETQLVKTWNNNSSSVITFDIISISNTEMILQIQEVRQNINYTFTFKYIH